MVWVVCQPLSSWFPFYFCLLVNGRTQAKVEWLGKLEEVAMLQQGMTGASVLHFFCFLFGKTCVHQN